MATKNKEEQTIQVVYVCTQCDTEKIYYEKAECLGIVESQKYCTGKCGGKLILHKKKKVPEPSPSP